MSTVSEAAAFEPLTPERRRAMTRRHLLDAAAAVFTEKGFHGATLDEVAARAGFTKGAVYSNFKSKDDLFLALLDDRVERQMAIIGAELEEGPRDRDVELPRMLDLIRAVMFREENAEFTLLFLEFVLYARRNPEARAKLVAMARHDRANTVEMIRREWERRGATPKFDVEAEATISLALFNGLGLAQLVDPESVDESTLATALDFMYEALGVRDEDLSSEGD
jgi:AcrR family transcriptional regulator